MYNANLINVEFNKIDLSGDIKINRKIISTLNINESNNTNKEISIDSSQSITVTSRDAQGQLATYRTSVNVTVSIKIKIKPLKQSHLTKIFLIIILKINMIYLFIKKMFKII